MLLHLLCLIPRNQLDDFHVFGDWSFFFLAEGSRADRLEKCTHGKHHVSFRMRDHLCSGMQSPCHPCPRGRRHRARLSAGGRWIRIWSSCVVRPLPHGQFWVRVDGSDCQTSVPWSHSGRTRSSDPRAQTRRHASSSPKLVDGEPLLNRTVSHTALSNRCWVDMLLPLAGVLHGPDL